MGRFIHNVVKEQRGVLSMDHKIGAYAFLVGVAIAILAGIFSPASTQSTVALILVALGLIVGFLNISEKEVTSFLIAAIALIAVGQAGLSVITVANLGNILSAMVDNIKLFVAPAALVVALKEVRQLAEN